MSVDIRDGGALRRATEMSVRIEDGRHPVERASIRIEAGIFEFYRRGIRATANPDNVSGFSRSRTGPVVSSTVVVSVSGGTPPYTHSWASDGGIFATQPNQPTTAFRGTPQANAGDLYGVLVDSITDANGLTATVSVGVSLTRESGV